MPSEGGLFQSIWRSRVVLLSGFGLVGVGAVIGAGSVYLFYIRHKLNHIYQLQSTLSSQVQTLKTEVDKVSENLSKTNGAAGSGPVPNRKNTKRTVRFKDGYETADEDEYVTASSDSDEDILPAILDHLDIPTDTDGAEDWVSEFLLNVDELLDGNANSQHEAYIRLQNNKDKLGMYCGFWWRFAKATHMEASAAGVVGDSEMKKSLILAGCARAERALQLDNGSANANKWYAITLGSKGEYVSINEKIKNGFIFKEYVDRAVKINPNDPSLHYLLGRFCFEVATLGWVERKVASTLFSAPPSSTPQEALRHFQASERLGKALKDNRLFMAKTYVLMKNYEQAAYWLKKALEMPNVSNSDKPIHEEALKLWGKYGNYLNKSA